MTDNTATQFNWKLYLNDQLYDSNSVTSTDYANNNGVVSAGVGYIFDNLVENTFNSVKILATDSNGNESSPFEVSFTTTGDTYVGDLDFIEIPRSDIEFFDDNQYVSVIGDMHIWNIGFSNNTSFSFFHHIEQVIGNITIDGIYTAGPDFNLFPDLIDLNGDLTLLNIDSSNFFNNLGTISGELQMVQCAQSQANSNNPMFENLISVGNVLMYEGGVIHSVSFESLTNINGKLSIFTMFSSFQDLDFLENVTHINQGLEIFGNYSLTDYCGLTTVINSNGLNGYSVSENAYNPTVTDIQNGNCSQ